MYQVQVAICKQEDGLWRAQVPVLPGCWVDATTLEQALSEIQEVIAMCLDIALEEGEELPAPVKQTGDDLPIVIALPIVLQEYRFKRLRVARSSRPAAAR